MIGRVASDSGASQQSRGTLIFFDAIFILFNFLFDAFFFGCVSPYHLDHMKARELSLDINNV